MSTTAPIERAGSSDAALVRGLDTWAASPMFQKTPMNDATRLCTGAELADGRRKVRDANERGREPADLPPLPAVSFNGIKGADSAGLAHPDCLRKPKYVLVLASDQRKGIGKIRNYVWRRGSGGFSRASGRLELQPWPAGIMISEARTEMTSRFLSNSHSFFVPRSALWIFFALHVEDSVCHFFHPWLERR